MRRHRRLLTKLSDTSRDPRTGEEARTCATMLKQIIATIAYAGPRWLRENRVTVVFKSETRSPVPSSVETIARTTMPGTDLYTATMRLRARVTTLPSAILPKHETLTQIRPRPGYIGSSPRLKCCRAIREAKMEGGPHPLLSTSVLPPAACWVIAPSQLLVHDLDAGMYIVARTRAVHFRWAVSFRRPQTARDAGPAGF
jgi:hypothetical protein